MAILKKRLNVMAVFMGFERFNGFLADFPTNKRSVEIQIMRKFQQIGFATDMKHKEFGEFSDFY